MTSSTMRGALLAATVSSFIAASPARACASCGCTLTADWLSQGLAAQPGATFSLRYDYVPQAELQTGTRRVDRSAITFPTDREIERHTFNHSLTATLDHQFASDFGLMSNCRSCRGRTAPSAKIR